MIIDELRKLLSLLALALATVPYAAIADGIVYGQFPTFSPAYFSYDYEGTRLDAEPGFPAQTYDLQIQGETAFTFYSGFVFSIIPSSSNAVVSVQPGLPVTAAAFAVPVAPSQTIGSDAVGFGWVRNLGSDVPFLNGSILTSAQDGHVVGEPPLTVGHFTGIESGYIGLQINREGHTYYGWVRAGAPIVGWNGGWIYDYAYETSPNKPIMAGAGVPTNRFIATFSGTNQVRRNASAHTGTGTFSLTGNTLSYLLKFDPGFRPTSARIHGPAKVNSNSRRVVADLGEHLLVNLPQTALYHGEITLSPNQLKRLWRGRLYINLRSTAFPHGELRGQVVPAGR